MSLRGAGSPRKPQMPAAQGEGGVLFISGLTPPQVPLLYPGQFLRLRGMAPLLFLS